VKKLIIITILLSLLLTGCEEEPMDERIIEIVALNDSQGTSGNFFIGIGRVDSELVYHYYGKEGKGIKGGTIKARYAVVYQDLPEDKTPYIKKKIFILTNEYEIHIPPNSIKEEFNMDLK